MHAKLDTASDLNRYYWYYWGSHKCVFQNAVFLLSVCFILITDSSCQEPAHALARGGDAELPQHHGYVGMCACCVRMSNHSGCKPLQTLCVTLQGSLWAAWEGCSPRRLRVLLWGIVMNSSLTVERVMSSLPDCELQRHGWCGSLTQSVSGWEPQTGLWQTGLSWWYCATTSDLFPLHAVAWFILP